MEGSKLLDLVEGLWAPFAEGTESWKYGPREITKADNLLYVNFALDQQAKLLGELRKHFESDNEVLRVFTGWLSFSSV